MDLKPLLEWNRKVRHRYLDKLAELDWDYVACNRETSFHSLKETQVHIMECWEGYFGHLCLGRPWPDTDYGQYDSMEKVRAYTAQVEAKLADYLDPLTEAELHQQVEVLGGKGMVPVNLADILFQLIQEETHHRGEMIALLWQDDIEPPDMHYLRWKRKRDRA